MTDFDFQTTALAMLKDPIDALTLSDLARLAAAQGHAVVPEAPTADIKRRLGGWGQNIVARYIAVIEAGRVKP